MSTGGKIRVARKIKKMSQRELGEIVDLSSQAIGQFERGDNVMTVKTLIKIAKALNVTTGWLLSIPPHQPTG